MPADASAITRWEFLRGANRTWTWRIVRARGVKDPESAVFPDLRRAIESARAQGFDPSAHYWTTTVDGRATHFRPGQAPLNLPAAD